MGCHAERPRPHVWLVTLDTTRADHLAAYGSDRTRTPAYDRMAREGARVLRAVAPQPVTLPSHASILTGAYPPAHGVRDNAIYALADENDTLAEILRREGYATAAFVGAIVLERRYGLDQGFSVYDDDLSDAESPPLYMFRERRAAAVIDAARDWLEGELQTGGERPFFLWTHLFDAHQTYEPPTPYDTEYIGHPYAGEISYAADQVERLMDWLEGRGILDRTLVVVTGDHGDSLGEHGEPTHGIFLYDSTLWVPLLLRWPAEVPAGMQIVGLRSLVDIVPTILELLRLPIPSAVQGRSLLGPPDLGREIYSETELPRNAYGWSPLQAIRKGDWLYVRAPHPELYDGKDDPEALLSLADERPNEVARFEERLLQFEQGMSAHAARVRRVEPDPQMRKRLEELGYLWTERASTDSREELPDPKDRIRVQAVLFAAIQKARAGRFEDSFPLFERALAADPQNVAAYFRYADARKNAGEAEARHEVFTRMVKAIPLEAPGGNAAREALGHSAFRLGRPQEAERIYQELTLARPTDGTAWARLGDARFRLGRPEAAAQAYEEALRLRPMADVENNLAWLLLETGASPKRALGLARTATRRSPRVAAFWDTLSAAAEQIGDHALAREAAANAVRLAPEAEQYRERSRRLESRP